MNISVNIPSFRRGSVKLSTLKLFPFCKVWVDHLEAEEYRATNPGIDIVSCKEGIQGNVARIRNHIVRTELLNGADVVVILDDDLQSINHFEKAEGSAYGYQRFKIVGDELLEVIEKYTIMAQDIGAKLWGMNCNMDNMAYRHSTPFSTRSFVGGPFQAFLKGNRCWYDERLPLKEDYDMTLQQLNLERVVFRVNKYHYICKQSTNSGGCAEMRNRTKEKEQLFLLQKKWGSKIVKIDNSNKTNGKDKLLDYNPIIRAPIKGV